MRGERRRKMKQVLFNKIKREELETGDHIYTWRYHKVYAHHGIYVGDGKVIHFTPAAGRELETGTIIDPVIFSSSDHRPASHDHSEYSQCPRCDPRNNNVGGVKSSCLECFLSGDKLYRFRYGVSKPLFYLQFRGTSTLVHSDSPEYVLHRAITLLDNGFRNYNLFKNNCENFAIYCKTGYVETASCGQIGSLRAAAIASIWPITPIVSIPALASAAGIATGTTFVVTMGCGAVLGGAMAYCVYRYLSDIGVRKGMEKIPVLTLVYEQVKFEHQMPGSICGEIELVSQYAVAEDSGFRGRGVLTRL